MVCLGFEPRAAGWKAQTNPLSYGGIPDVIMLLLTSWIGRNGLFDTNSFLIILCLTYNLYFEKVKCTLTVGPH